MNFVLKIGHRGARAYEPENTLRSFQNEDGVLKEWSSDMKRIKITTEERGLTYRITVTNVGDDRVTVDKLTIQVDVTKTGNVGGFFKTVNP